MDIGNILTEEDGAGDRNENIGHVKQIYMFGYYEGVLPGTESGLSIYLGRIIARIEVNFTIDDPEDLKKKFYIGLANMETKAYVFPGAQSPNAEDAWLDMKPTERSERSGPGPANSTFMPLRIRPMFPTRPPGCRYGTWTKEPSLRTTMFPPPSCYAIIRIRGRKMPWKGTII